MSDPTAISRRLVAVFAADVEGYSRLMGADEVGTLKGLTERRAILDRIIGEHRGRIANTAGDSVLAEFGSAVDAVQCAVEAQTALAEANSSQAPDRRICFRIGIHIGDVMIRAGDLFGDGVNIAARLQSVAKPGGVCISPARHTIRCARSCRSHLRTLVPCTSRTFRSRSERIRRSLKRESLRLLPKARARRPFPTSPPSRSYRSRTCPATPNKSILQTEWLRK